MLRKLAFLILPEFQNFGLAAAIEPLFIANWLARTPIFDWKSVSADGQPVRASNGAMVAVDGDLAAAEDCATVFVLASFDPAAVSRDRVVVRWLRRVARFGVEIGAIENGSYALAEAGLLDGHVAAIHWDNLVGFQERYPEIAAAAQLYAFSGARITCAGSSAILDMMVGWIARHGDDGLAAEVADHLLLGPPRPAETGQRRSLSGAGDNGSDSIVAQAQDLMRGHVDEPLPCADIASGLGLSLRQMERRFRRALDRSVLQEYQRIRIDRAHQLLQQTELSVTQIAFSCGFSSPEYFARQYRAAYGCPPSADRRQSTAAPVSRRTQPRRSSRDDA
jgi:AraC family carnitine catabolism transcriptional activator